MYTVTLYYKTTETRVPILFSADNIDFDTANKKAYEKAQAWLDTQDDFESLDFDGVDWYKW